MPTFVYQSLCDGCGECVKVCPSDIMHIEPKTRRAVNVEPDMCWECFSCVKACPQHAVDMRSYADFAPLGHGTTVIRDEVANRIYWKITYRDGRVKRFDFPIRTTKWGSTQPAQAFTLAQEKLNTELLAHEPEMLMTGKDLPTLKPAKNTTATESKG
jgi:adenylylsulfate reductase subunit B